MANTKLFIFVHTAKCAGIMTAPNGHLNNQAARLAGRAVNSTFVSHLYTPSIWLYII